MQVFQVERLGDEVIGSRQVSGLDLLRTVFFSQENDVGLRLQLHGANPVAGGEPGHFGQVPIQNAEVHVARQQCGASLFAIGRQDYFTAPILACGVSEIADRISAANKHSQLFHFLGLP